MMNKKELVKAAKELNKIIQPDVPISTAAKTEDEVEVMKAGILEAASLLVEDDEVSEATQAVIDALFEEQDDSDDTDEGSQDEAPEDEEDSPEDEDDEQSTEDLVTEASFKDLLQIAENYPEFKKIDTKGLKSKDAEKLRKKMLKALAPKEEAPAKEEKKTAKKSDKVKGPGVIATIASCIEGSGKKGITKDEILKALVIAFPERDATSMSKTINVQVPARISKEKFKVDSKDGRYFKA